MEPFYFTIPRRPISQQARRSARREEWKAYIRSIVEPQWPYGSPLELENFSIAYIYLSDESPLDIDNVIKPIQDALVGIVFHDDGVVTDVIGHRRDRTGLFDVDRLPVPVLEAIDLGSECVVVRISSGVEIGDVW